MRSDPRLLVFSALYGIVYTYSFYTTWALFRFYPAYSQFSFAPLGPEAGPAILWYGWLANAFIVSGVVALLTPKSIATHVKPTAVCGVAVAVLAVIVFALREWFI